MYVAKNEFKQNKLFNTQFTLKKLKKTRNRRGGTRTHEATDA